MARVAESWQSAEEETVPGERHALDGRGDAPATEPPVEGERSRSWLAKIARYYHAALVGLAFLVFWSGGSLYSWIYLPRLKARVGPERARGACQVAVQKRFIWFMDLLRGWGLWNFDPRQYPRRFSGPCVIVANHPTLLDVVAMIASYEKVCVVVKPGIFHGWSVGKLLRSCGHLAGADGGAADTQRFIDESVERLESGDAVLVFPEGTRSPTGTMSSFHRGPFEVAARAGVPVVPVSIHCDPPALMKGMPWYEVPAEFVRYGFEELAPVPVGGERSAVRAAVAAVETQLRRRLGPPTGSAAKAADPVGDAPRPSP